MDWHSILVANAFVVIASISSKNIVTKYSPNKWWFLFINQSPDFKLYGLRNTFNTSFKNLVNIPGAGAQSKGRPIAKKNSLSILNWKNYTIL